MRTNGKTALIRDFLTELIKGKPEVLPRPVLDKNSQSNLKGLFIIGDLAGVPLFKTTAEQGTLIIKHLASNANGKKELGNYDVVIAGTGAAGLAAALAAQEKGLKYALFE